MELRISFLVESLKEEKISLKRAKYIQCKVQTFQKLNLHNLSQWTIMHFYVLTMEYEFTLSICSCFFSIYSKRYFYQLPSCLEIFRAASKTNLSAVWVLQRSFKDFCPKIHLQFIFRCRRILEASKILGWRLRRFFGKIQQYFGQNCLKKFRNMYSIFPTQC